MQHFLNSTRRSVAWFKQAHDNQQLIMRPPFQRNPVWTESQQSFLIDTIMRGYPIPELYMQETVDESGSERYVVVDGQQRVRAFLLFIEGKLALNRDKSPQWADMRFDDLGPDQKRLVFGYNFIVRQLPSIPDPEIREIFGRLNLNNVALNRQELRHATYWGPFISCMEALSDRGYWTSSGIFTPNDIRRMLAVCGKGCHAGPYAASSLPPPSSAARMSA